MEEDKYMIFVYESEDWVQDSDIIIGLEEAKKWCDYWLRERHYLLVKIIEER